MQSYLSSFVSQTQNISYLFTNSPNSGNCILHSKPQIFKDANLSNFLLCLILLSVGFAKQLLFSLSLEFSFSEVLLLEG